jgi:sugar phosphate isomerase/epimerase
MTRLSMSELTTFRWTFEEDVQRFAEAGFQGIGVWRPKLIECGEERGIDLLLEHGLSVSSLMWAGGFTGSDGRTFSFSLDDAFEALRLAAVIRAECLIVYTGGRGGHTHGHARKLVRHALRELMEAAQELDVTLAVEPMHPGCGWEWTFLNDLQDTMRLLDEVPGLKLVFDMYHWCDATGLEEKIPQIASKIALVQLADAMRAPCGEQDRLPVGSGLLPLKEWSHLLIESGYTGFFETELLGPEIETCCYQTLLTQTLESLGNLASVRP